MLKDINIVEDVAEELLKLAVTELPQDVKQALQRAYNEEDSETEKTQLKAILDNVAFQCWASRRATTLIHSEGIVEYLTHEVD